jgi:hypothetical protein
MRVAQFLCRRRVAYGPGFSPRDLVLGIHISSSVTFRIQEHRRKSRGLANHHRKSNHSEQVLLRYFGGKPLQITDGSTFRIEAGKSFASCRSTPESDVPLPLDTGCKPSGCSCLVLSAESNSNVNWKITIFSAGSLHSRSSP